MFHNLPNTLHRLCAPPGNPLPAPRTFLVVAHPDDEIIGASSLLERRRISAVVYVTDGAPREGSDARAAGCDSSANYAALRHEEAMRALTLAGISTGRIHFLDHPDQEAALRLPLLVEDIRRLIVATAPEAILTHAYEGGHPDHDSVALAVHVAVAEVACDGRVTPPEIIEFAGYHARGDAWEFSTFLPAVGTDERTVPLSPRARDWKTRLLACHASQQRTLSAVPLDVERFRAAPAYDFTRPPHDGPLLYEMYPWGMTALRWRDLARDALEVLRPASVLTK